MSTTSAAHIRLDQDGVAWVDQTQVKVIEIVLDKFAYGWSAEEIHFQHPNLSLAQIHAALSYYYDHQAELDAEIQRRADEMEKLAVQSRPSPLQKRLAGFRSKP